MSDVHERLRRLLFLVPYVSKHPGLTVEELAGALGTSREDLLEELDLLAFVGRPPFQPDDYIDIYVENGRVYVDLDQRLSAPPRLTAAEAAALAAAAEALRPTANEALSSALSKLERILPAGVRQRFREMERKIDAHLGAPAEVGLLARGVSESREVEFDYFSPNRGTTERRKVRPKELLSHRGQWYLSGYCESRQGDRLFRLDRIQALTLTDRSFEAPPSQTSRALLPPERGAQVRVRFSPTAAPYMAERFGAQGRRTPDGSLEVTVSGDSERWLTQWILSFGGEAEVLEPAWARTAVAKAAQASLELQAKA
jgi:proteasome accessory factor C